MNRSERTQPHLFLLMLNGIALLGVGISVVLTEHFYQLRNGTSAFKSFCNIGQTFNCDVVTSSSFSEIIWGLPVSSFSAGWFLALLFISLFIHNPFWKREAVRISFGLSILSTLIGIPYILIMAWHLKTYCILCLCIDVLSLASLLIIFFGLKPEGFSIHKPDLSKWKMLISILGACLFVAVVGLRTLDHLEIPATQISEWAEKILHTPSLAIKKGRDTAAIGPKSAPITIVEFSDFQCPFCKNGALILNSILNRYPQKIRVEFRHFPLNQACNPSVQQTAHPAACEAAGLVICAEKQHQFEAVYQALFEKQSALASGKAVQVAQEAGLSIDGKSCASSVETGLEIARDAEEGTSLGVTSTPTFFVNGHKMEGAYPVPVWIKIIDELLAHETH